MSSFEEIINREKAVSYNQRDKELFSFYTLTLIAQEQASRKTRRQLLVFSVLLTACLLMLLSPINQVTGNLSTYLSAMDIVDIFKMALVSYGFLGLLFVLFKSRVSLFR
jgi:hypothetical protein